MHVESGRQRGGGEEEGEGEGGVVSLIINVRNIREMAIFRARS